MNKKQINRAFMTHIADNMDRFLEGNAMSETLVQNEYKSFLSSLSATVKRVRKYEIENWAPPSGAMSVDYLNGILTRQIMPSYDIINLSDTLRFGKHSGETMQWIVENDPRWVVWACKIKKIDLVHLFYINHRGLVDGLEDKLQLCGVLTY